MSAIVAVVEFEEKSAGVGLTIVSNNWLTPRKKKVFWTDNICGHLKKEKILTVRHGKSSTFPEFCMEVVCTII